MKYYYLVLAISIGTVAHVIAAPARVQDEHLRTDRHSPYNLQRQPPRLRRTYQRLPSSNIERTPQQAVNSDNINDSNHSVPFRQPSIASDDSPTELLDQTDDSQQNADLADQSDSSLQSSTSLEYFCGRCPRVFHHRELWMEHKETHLPAKDRPLFSCDNCSLSYTLRGNLVQHQNKKHVIQKCDDCGKEFVGLDRLRDHQLDPPDHTHKSAVAKWRFQCSACPKNYVNNVERQKHYNLKHKVMKCHSCEGEFRGEHKLRKHQKNSCGSAGAACISSEE